MINLNNKISINQVVKMTNNETGEVDYLIMNNNKWEKITKDQYDKIRGYKNE